MVPLEPQQKVLVSEAFLTTEHGEIGCEDCHGGDPEKIKKRIDEYQTRFANPFVAAERGYIDEVIAPRGTRPRIARALQMLRNKHVENPWKKHDNIPL